jgi:hypothetical protein
MKRKLFPKSGARRRAVCLLLAFGGILAAATDEIRHVMVYEQPGDFAAWPANGGFWSWGNELLVCYELGAYKPREGNHAFDPDVPLRCVFSRSMDGGETWTFEEHANVPLPARIDGYISKPDAVDFTGDGFAMKFRDAYMWLSENRGRSWLGPLWTSNQKDFVLLNRTNYIVTGGAGALVFMTVREKLKEGQVVNRNRSWVWRTSDSGKTFKRISMIGEEEKFDGVAPEYDAYSIMPSALRLGEGHYICAARELIRREKWVRIYESRDSGQTWAALADIAQGAHNPAALAALADGRVVAVYGARENGPRGIFARTSADDGRTWGAELVLRSDAASWDFGYPVATVRPDGVVVAIYYMSTAETPHQHIAATLWKPAYARPEIHVIEPAIVTPGATVVITGKNLHYVTGVRFAGVEAVVLESAGAGGQITVLAPDSLPAQGGEVRVTAAGGETGGARFTLEPSVRPDDNAGSKVSRKSSAKGGGAPTGICFFALPMLLCARLLKRNPKSKKPV